MAPRILVNEKTNEFHKENDSIYTVISNPIQERRSQSEYSYSFVFKAEDKYYISIRLIEGIYFV